MRAKGKALGALAVLLFTVVCFSLIAGASVVESGEPKEIRVPITLEVPYAIAGAEFEIEYTAGLKLLSFEKSETIGMAATTPVVEKDGKAYFGFYHGSNDFEPEDGVLDVGYLIFEYMGGADQSVVVTEAKYVQVIDKDTTNSNLLTLNERIDVPLTPGAGLFIGQKSYTMWFILGGALVLAAIVVAVVLIRRKKKKKSEQ